MYIIYCFTLLSDPDMKYEGIKNAKSNKLWSFNEVCIKFLLSEMSLFFSFFKQIASDATIFPDKVLSKTSVLGYQGGNSVNRAWLTLSITDVWRKTVNISKVNITLPNLLWLLLPF